MNSSYTRRQNHPPAVDRTFEELHAEACNRGEHTYCDPLTGRSVFTKFFHLDRGSCCNSSCRHCPWQDEGGEGEQVLG